MDGKSSNSVPDWLRVLDLDDLDENLDNLDDDLGDDVNEDVPPGDGGETSLMNVCSSSVGPGLSPGHSHM